MRALLIETNQSSSSSSVPVAPRAAISSEKEKPSSRSCLPISRMPRAGMLSMSRGRRTPMKRKRNGTSRSRRAPPSVKTAMKAITSEKTSAMPLNTIASGLMAAQHRPALVMGPLMASETSIPSSSSRARRLSEHTPSRLTEQNLRSPSYRSILIICV